MKDIIFKAMNHPDIKWNVTKNKMYKDLVEPKPKDNKDKHWFFSNEFPPEVCKLIMTYKREDEKYYIECFIKENKLKEEYMIQYLLSHYTRDHYNKHLKGRTKHLKQRMSAKDLSSLLYYAINRLKNPDFIKDTDKSYRKLSLLDAQEFCNEKYCENSKQKIEELKPYEFLKNKGHYMVRCRYKGYPKTTKGIERVYIIEHKKHSIPAYVFFIPLKVVDGKVQSAKNIEEMISEETRYHKTRGDGTIEKNICVTQPEGYNMDMLFNLKIKNEWKNKASFKNIVNNLEIISQEELPETLAPLFVCSNNYINSKDYKDIDYLE